MRDRSINLWETLAALGIVALGGFVFWVGSAYPIGSLTRMGPGFFPTVLGIGLMAVGGALVLEVLRIQTPAPEFPLRPFIMVGGGLISFALLAERFGLVPAVVSLVVLSSLGERSPHPWAMAILAVVLSAVGMLLFVRGFNLPFRAIRW